jgi:hypothetical protein
VHRRKTWWTKPAEMEKCVNIKNPFTFYDKKLSQRKLKENRQKAKV